MPYMPMAHEEDPRDVIFKQIGLKKDKIPGVKLLKNDVLVGIYMRPKVTKSGIHLSDQTIKEDEHQGKAALVLMKGPTAFTSDENYQFLPEQNVEVGEWIALWVSDGKKIVVNGQLCRVIRDQDIIMKIERPDQVF